MRLCLLWRVYIWIDAICNSFAVMERDCSCGHGAWNQRCFLNTNYRCYLCFFCAMMFVAGKHPDAPCPSPGKAHLYPSSSWRSFNVFQNCAMLKIWQQMKQNNFCSFLFSFTDLTGMSSARTKSHVSFLQEDFIHNITENRIWFLTSSLSLCNSTFFTITSACKSWCLMVGCTWVNRFPVHQHWFIRQD